MIDADEMAVVIDACIVATQRIMLTTRDQAGREKGERALARYTEIAKLLRVYSADPNQETAQRIEDIFTAIRLEHGRRERYAGPA